MATTTTTSLTSIVTSATESSSSIVGPMKKWPPTAPSDETTVEDLVMDDCAAAMVLMSLSCSPKSPLALLKQQQQSFSQQHHNFSTSIGNYSTSWVSNGDSSVDSGIVVEVGSPPNSFVPHPLHPKVRVITSPSNYSPNMSLHSPVLSEIPTVIRIKRGSRHIVPTMTTTPDFEMTDVSAVNNVQQSQQQAQQLPHKKRTKTRIIFACTWPGCDAKYRQNSAIERHVRTVHLGPSVEENEEEFYYTEIEVEEYEFFERFHHRSKQNQQRLLDSPSVTTNSCESESISEGSSTSGLSPVTSPGPYSFSPSAPTWSHLDMARPPHEDPEYQEQLKRQRLSSPIDIPGRFNSNNNNNGYAHHNTMVSNNRGGSGGANKSRYEGKSLLASTSPKGRTVRTRGDVRKCRKVYGMEARDSWCTQCRWKKACIRFVD